MEIRFDNQTVVVYGAGRGIGEAIVRAFAKNGANVYIADIIYENTKNLRDSVRAQGFKAEACECDVTKIDQVDAVMAKAEEETGRLDVVINNAGIVSLASFLDADQDDIMSLIKVNQMGANNGCQCALKRMKKYNHGKVVNTASFAGRHAMREGFAHYGMTKAAIIYLTQAAAYAGADYNINVNSVCPGIIRTAMWEKILDADEQSGKDRETAWKESLKHFIPLDRGDQKPEDIANAFLFLASPMADHVTGQALNVDGGASMD